MTLQEREKRLLALASIILVLAIFWFVYRPNYEHFQELKNNVNLCKIQLKNSKIDDQSIQDKENELENINKEISELLKQIPKTEKRGFLIRDIQNLAQSSGVLISGFVPKDPIPVTIGGKEILPQMQKLKSKRKQLDIQHARVLKTLINIDASGKFENLTKFLANLITYYRAVELSDISISRTGVASVDKRFGTGSNNQNPIAQAKNTDLNINLTLVAYTSLPESDNQDD